MNRTPFTVQELLDRCIHFLRDSTPDLLACALVSRRRVYPAQSHIFREISIIILGQDVMASKNMILCARLEETLKASPHLIAHIRRLHFALDKERLPVLSQICNFPFTRLEHVKCVYRGIFVLQCALALQQLFSLPTLRCVKLTGPSPPPEIFAKMFEGCSPAIRNLELRFAGDMPLPASPDRVAAPIALVSLVVATTGGIDRHLLPALCPFNVSHLKALAITAFGDVAWHALAPSMSTLEILSITVQHRHMGLDLCAFPRLSVLRIAPVRIIDLSSQSDAVGTLVSTISRAPHVRTVVVSLTKIGPEICDPLDLGLSSLPLHTVKFEVNPEAYDEAAGFFPRLRAKNMLHIIYHGPQWWEDLIEGL